MAFLCMVHRCLSQHLFLFFVLLLRPRSALWVLVPVTSTNMSLLRGGVVWSVFFSSNLMPLVWQVGCGVHGLCTLAVLPRMCTTSAGTECVPLLHEQGVYPFCKTRACTASAGTECEPLLQEQVCSATAKSLLLGQDVVKTRNLHRAAKCRAADWLCSSPLAMS